MAALDTPRVLTIDESRQYLRIPYKKMLGLVHSGEVHARQIGNVWRVPVDELEKYLNAGRKIPAQPSPAATRTRARRIA